MQFPYPGTFLCLLFMNLTIDVVSGFKFHIPGLSPRYTDPGIEYGSLYIINSCKNHMKARSVGAYSQNSSRDAEFMIPVGNTYYEPFRETIPISKEEAKEMVETHKPPIDSASGKMKGQGISFMVTTPNNTDWGHGITQLEYSLIQNPENSDAFKRLWYDVSLLNCAEPESAFSDVDASMDRKLNQEKVDRCPGYQNGIAMWTSDPKSCRPIYCDGEQYCESIYNYEKTRVNEASFQCTDEYRGNLYVELCAGNGNGTSYQVYENWRKAGNITNVIIPNPPSTNISAPSGTDARFFNTTAFRTGLRFSPSNTSYTGTSQPTTSIVSFAKDFSYASETLNATTTSTLTCPTCPACSHTQSDMSCTFNTVASTSECWSRMHSTTALTTSEVLLSTESSTILPTESSFITEALESTASETLSSDVTSTEDSSSEDSMTASEPTTSESVSTDVTSTEDPSSEETMTTSEPTTSEPVSTDATSTENSSSEEAMTTFESASTDEASSSSGMTGFSYLTETTEVSGVRQVSTTTVWTTTHVTITSSVRGV